MINRDKEIENKQNSIQKFISINRTWTIYWNKFQHNINKTRSRIEPAHPKILIETAPKSPIGLIEPAIVLERIR